MAEVVCKMVLEHQEQRVKVTQNVIDHFFNRNRKFNMERTQRNPVKLDEDYSNYGINYDLTFGLAAPVSKVDTPSKVSMVTSV